MRKEKAGAFAIGAVALLVLLGAPGRALAQQAAPEPHTAAAVIADDDGWLKAEETGDTTYLDALLLPEYRTVNLDGTWQDKTFILRGASKQAGNPTFAKMVETWKATHPTLTSVAINGDVAILTFALNKGSDPKRIMSCDVFVYRDGHWHALYSQHSDAEK
jgi:hypothetical protein